MISNSDGSSPWTAFVRPRKNILSDERGRKGFRSENEKYQDTRDRTSRVSQVGQYSHMSTATAAAIKKDVQPSEITYRCSARTVKRYCLRTRTPSLRRLAERTRNRSAPKPTPTLRQNKKSTATKSYYEWVTPSTLDQMAQI